jgi:hypothetical protein
MEPDRHTWGIVLVAVLAIFAAVLVSALMFGFPENGDSPADEPMQYVLSQSSEPPDSTMTGVLGLEVSLRGGELTVIDEYAKFYNGKEFYYLRESAHETSLSSLKELQELGAAISTSSPFVLVELGADPWYGPGSGEGDAIPGNLVIRSIVEIGDLNLTDIIGELSTDLLGMLPSYDEDIAISRETLDPRAYNSERTLVFVTYVDSSPLVIFDGLALYEGPLEWYIEPLHLFIAAYELTGSGKVSASTFIPPNIAWAEREGLRVSCFLPDYQSPAGEELIFRFALKNTGQETYKATAGPPFFDIHLHDQESEVGSWSSGKAFPEYAEMIDLSPGEARRESIQWIPSAYVEGAQRPVDPGEYSVTATWVPENLETDGCVLEIVP